MNIFFAIPTYDGHIDVRSVNAIFNASKQGVSRIAYSSNSLLAYNFNGMWSTALNERKNGITHFLMLHADIIPLDSENWVNILIQEMERTQADILSVISPIKNFSGDTSTAVQSPEHEWAVKKYRMQELLEMPETFTNESLLVNTGLWIANITKPWAEQVYFEITDRIVKNTEGKFLAIVQSEDWHFSRQVRKLGGSIWATRKVKIAHIGPCEYDNNGNYLTKENIPSAFKPN